MWKKILFILIGISLVGCTSKQVEPLADMQNTYWKLISLNGENIKVFDNNDELHFIIKEGQANGSDGCNRFFMPVKINGQEITIEHGGSTRKMCMEGIEQGQNFLDTLTEATSWQIDGEMLKLSKGDVLIATFKAVYF